MQEKINNTALKEIHELCSNDFVLFSDYITYRAKHDRYKNQGLQIPDSLKSPIDDCIFPLGSKLWDSDNSELDGSVFVLTEFNISEVNIRSLKYAEAQEQLLGRNVRIDYFCELFKEGETFPPLIGYKQDTDVYLIDGNRRFLAAKKAGVQKVQIFIEEIDENGFTKNRKSYLDEAIASNKTINPLIQQEINKLQPSKDKRIFFRYSEKRRNEYPAIGDQLDAIHKYLRGNQNELTELWSDIDSIKSKYSKPIIE